MYDSLVIANYFINKSFVEGAEMTNMKVLKLVYISHGWFLGANSKPLISEAPLAWEYGPVVERVYHQFKHFRGNQITKLADLNSDFMISADEIAPSEEAIEGFLDAIWVGYKKFSGLELSAMTHYKGTPWDWTVRNLGVGSPIPQKKIEEYYQERLNGRGRGQ